MLKRLLAACLLQFACFLPLAEAQTGVDLVAAEYFIGADPGEGNGTPLALVDSGISGWRSLSSLDANLAGLGEAQKYSIRFKNASGAWSNPHVRVVLLRPANAVLHPAGPVPVERSMELESTTVGVTGAEAVSTVSGTSALVTEDFRFLAQLDGLAENNAGIQVYGFRARAAGAEWGNSIRAAAVVRGIPTDLQGTAVDASRAEIQFGVDGVGFSSGGRMQLRLGTSTIAQTRDDGESVAATLAKLSRSIRENAAVAAAYAVELSGDVLRVRLLAQRDFASGEVEALDGLIEAARTAYSGSGAGMFEISQPDAEGGIAVRSIVPTVDLGAAFFSQETEWSVLNFAASTPFTLVAKNAAGVTSNPLSRRIVGHPSTFAIQTKQPVGETPSVSLAVDSQSLSAGVRPGFVLSGTLVDVAWDGMGTSSDLILSRLVSLIRSDPVLGARYSVSVSGGSLVLRSMTERVFEAGELSGLVAMNQVAYTSPAPRGVMEVEYATANPAAAGTTFNKMPVVISNAGFLTAGSLDVLLNRVGNLGPVYVRAVSSTGAQSASLMRNAVIDGVGLQIHPAAATTNAASVTLSVDVGTLTGFSRPGFVIGGTLVDAPWSMFENNPEALLANLVGQIRSNSQLSSQYVAALVNGKLVLRTISASVGEAVKISDLKEMRFEGVVAPVSPATMELEYATSNPQQAGTVFTKIAGALSAGAFIHAGSVDVSLVAAGGVGCVYVRAIARDGVQSLPLVRSTLVTGSGLQIHPAAAALNGPSVTLAVDELELSNAGRIGFRLAGVDVDAEWSVGMQPSALVVALVSRIRSDSRLSSRYSATVSNGSLSVSSLTAVSGDPVEISDLIAMRVEESRAASNPAVLDLEFSVGVDGLPGTAFSKVPVTSLGSGFLVGGTVDLQFSRVSGIKRVGIRAVTSSGIRSEVLSGNVVVVGSGFELQSTSGAQNGSAAVFVMSPNLTPGEFAEVKLGGSNVRALIVPGMTSADLSGALVAEIRRSALLSQAYSVRVDGGSLRVETVAARGWQSGELEGIAFATLQIERTRTTQLEVDVFLGADPGASNSSRLTSPVEPLGGFVSYAAVDMQVSQTASVQRYGVRARNLGGAWSNSILGAVSVFGAGFQTHAIKPLVVSGSVELIPGAEFGRSSVRIEVMGVTLELGYRESESPAGLLQRIADAINGNRFIRDSWRAQITAGRLILDTVTPRAVSDDEVKGDGNLVAVLQERGRAPDESRGIAKIQIAEIAKDPVPVREILTENSRALLAAVEYGIGNVQQPPGVRRYAVRAVETGGQSGNWILGKVAVLNFTSPLDSIPPTLSLLGAGTIQVEVGSPFVDPGWDAMDAVSGNLTSAVTREGLVDTARPGIYTLIYRVLDDAGNAATALRTVRVTDSVPPDFSGMANVVTLQGSPFDPWIGFNANDLIDGDRSTFATIVSGSVNPAVPGTYNLTYRVTDNSGNYRETTRQVEVIQDAITFLEHPQSRTGNPSTDITLSVKAVGIGTLTYQWRKNGLPLAGADEPSLTIRTLADSDEGNYDVVVESPLGKRASAAAVVLVNDPASILIQPEGGALPLGGTWMLSVSASGDVPLAYQWKKDGIVINEGTGALFAATSPGAYSVVVTNAVGSVTSINAIVTAAPIAPGILLQPVGKNLSIGETITLMVTATGTAPLNYQWIRNGVVIQGATQPTFAPTETGSYSVVISNHAGAITSLPASVRVPRSIISFASEYEGLLTPSSSTHMDVAGIVSVFISRSGAVSGKIRTRSGFKRFAGKINQYGQITFAPHSSYWLPLMNVAEIEHGISLEITFNGTGNCLLGKVASRPDDATEILATLSAVPMKAPSVLHRGRYTALFQNVENQQTEYPEGDGYALLGVHSAGVTLAGQLADASRVAAFVKLSEDLTAPLFTPLYRGKGLIMGNLDFDYSQPKTDVTCFGMRWFKPGGVPFTVNYPKGWPSGVSVDFVASRYDSRKSLGDFMSLGAELNFSASGGNLDQQAYGKAKFLLPGFISVPQPSSIDLKIRFDRFTGGLWGSFIPTGATRPTTFSGVVLQKANFGSGFFIRDGESGLIQLGP